MILIHCGFALIEVCDMQRIHSACGGTHEASLKKCLGAKDYVGVHVGMCSTHHDWGTACAKSTEARGTCSKDWESLGMVGMWDANMER